MSDKKTTKQKEYLITFRACPDYQPRTVVVTAHRLSYAIQLATNTCSSLDENGIIVDYVHSEPLDDEEDKEDDKL